VVFEPVADGEKLGKGIRHQLFQRRPVGARLDAAAFGDRLRGADAGHHVLALGVDEELAVELLSPVDGLRVKATPVADSRP
jgi:hypothetical protein